MTPLQKHMQTYPGPYRPEEACNSHHNESWRQWVQRRDDLVEQQNVAKAKPTKWRDNHAGIARTAKVCYE